MRYLLISSLFLLLVQSGCLKPILCEPALVASFRQRPENLQLEFETDKGRQVAFYVPPLSSSDECPSKISILYPGIKSVALGWLRLIDLDESPTTAYLLIDYPGRGFSEGRMMPEEIYLNAEFALKVLAEHFGQDKIDAELNLMGHSFGTGAALQFAVRNQVENIVLVAPFNTLREAVAVRFPILSLLVPIQIDNRELIGTLLTSDHPPKITIYHGQLDSVLPVTMGRELASLAPESITFYEFPEDDHTSILNRRKNLIFRSLSGQNK